MKRNRARRRRNPTRRPPADTIDLADRAELILACENIATLAALLEEHRPDGIVLVNGGELHRHVGRMLAGESRRILNAMRRGNPRQHRQPDR